VWKSRRDSYLSYRRFSAYRARGYDEEHLMVDLAPIVAAINDGMVPPAIYCDDEIFAIERERIFGRAWMYLAHESEIPEPGDYVLRRIVDDSFIVVRDEAGEIRVLANICLHRGMQVCRAELGNASHFRCPYHAWTYKNTGELVGLPFHQDAYGGDAELDRASMSLLRPPRLAVHRGMIFVSLDESAPDFATYLGGFDFYLDFYLNQSEAGVEVQGPQRWTVDANWKIGAENFAGDTYHTPHTHASVVEIGLFREPKAHKRKEGALYFAGRGGGTTYKLPTRDFAENLAHVGYPPEMVERMRRSWTPEQQALVGEGQFMVSAASLLPNLSLVHNWPQVDADGLVVPFTSIRLWQPVSATKTEVYSWFAVDALAPEWFKQASYKAYLMCFGSSGMFEQDDVENWTSITAVARGRLAQRLLLNSRMGLRADGTLLNEPLPDWPAPGRAFTGFGEYNQRELLRLWSTYIADGGAPGSNGAPRRTPARSTGGMP
jgi:phenylpropionate dioxygenase-like ring-hydroxylating dioxygenase large terminal subunit